MKEITAKIPGGKLVRIAFEYNKAISSIRITGDFFLHPEDTITLIEQALVGKTVQEIATTVQSVLDAQSAQFVGVSAQDIQDLIAVEVNDDG